MSAWTFSQREAMRRLIDFYRRLHKRPECRHPRALLDPDHVGGWAACRGCGRALREREWA